MDNFVPRKFQQEAKDAFFDYYKTGGSGNIILALFTGLGKSFVIAMIICEMLKKNKKLRILIVCHSESVLTQDYNAMYGLLSFYNIFATLGVYSSKLKRKDIDKQ
ncbi:DEAD/DEAH box helicase family protein, partial [Candidatus Woesearchaeota archaeon]|nr:DEAD/DEAH box helicase family protein [Candidatus Woesearchaeota archaeon]